MSTKSTRKSILLNEYSQQHLECLVKSLRSWAFRTNTIIQAAIVAFARMDEKTQREVLKEIRKKDGRFM